MRIIGISGRAESGKDTVADHLVEVGLVDKKYMFATYLKQMCHDMFNIPTNDLYNGKNKLTNVKITKLVEFLIPELYDRIGEYLTVREVLQYFGTNVVRTFFPDCWVNAAFNCIKDDGTIIISDVRFLNEVRAIQNTGGIVIRLTRCVTDMTHESEILLDEFNGFDIVYDNATESVEQTLSGIEVKVREKLSE